MSLSISQALLAVLAIALVTLLCRAAPFLFFGNAADSPGRRAFIAFVERSVPPVAMSVLAVSSLAAELKGADLPAVAALCAAILTVSLHVWKRNPLISIIGGTILYMALRRFL